MRVLEAPFVQGFIRLCGDGFNQNWHERNGGNLSYRVKAEEIESVKEELSWDKPWQPIGTGVPGLAGEYFLVTGSGKYFRNVSIKPEDSICMIELDERGREAENIFGMCPWILRRISALWRLTGQGKITESAGDW